MSGYAPLQNAEFGPISRKVPWVLKTAPRAAGICLLAMAAACRRECQREAISEAAVQRATREHHADCVERWAEHVCTWTPAKHAERERSLAQLEAEKKPFELQEPEELYCGCLAQPYTRCFMQLSTSEPGFTVYHVATGAPGCGQTPEARRVLRPPWTSVRSGASDKADPAVCGSVFRLEYQRDHAGAR